jgi:acetyl esterase/lipase
LGLILSCFVFTAISEGQEVPTTPSPSPTPLQSQFQPSAYQSGDTTVLSRIEFVPQGSGLKPIAIVIHGGGFHGGSYNAPTATPVYYDLLQAGFIVFGIIHRLAPPGLIPGQAPHDDATSGRPPEQSNDVKQNVLSARFDPRGNGTVVVVGDSSGGSHGVWVAIDQASEGGLGWLPQNRVDAVSSCSGAYDYSKIDPTKPANGDPDLVRQFREVAINYTNLARDDIDGLHALSPVALVTSSDVKPLQLLDGSYDASTGVGETMPAGQRVYMTNALTSKGVTDFDSRHINILAHSFAYWRSIDPDTGITVGQEVINFLNAHIPPH